MDTNLIPIIILIVISIIGYFLRDTMSTVKEVQKMTIVNKAKINLVDELRLDCNNKILTLGISDFTYRRSVKDL